MGMSWWWKRLASMASFRLSPRKRTRRTTFRQTFTDDLVGAKVKTEGPIAASKALEHTMQLKWTKNVQLYNLHSSKPEFLVWIESGYHL